jgi:hypothetical protein
MAPAESQPVLPPLGAGVDPVDLEPIPPYVNGVLIGGLFIRGPDGLVVAEIKCNRHEMYVKCPQCKAVRTRNFTRSAQPAKQYQGRPLGYLAAWVLKGSEPQFLDAAEHKHPDSNPTFAERQACRARLAAEPNALVFFNLERKRRRGEGEEPEIFK